MGWCSGSGLMSDIIDVLKVSIPGARLRQAAYVKIINSFEYYDWDSQQDCMGVDQAFDDALRQVHPDWDLDDLDME